MEHPVPGLVASAEEQLSWITTVCDQGIRRPGSGADRWVTDWTAERFRAEGLEDVRLEPVVLPRWEPTSWSLTVDGAHIDCFPLPHTAPGTVEGPLVTGDTRGAIALSTVTLTRLPQTLMRDRALRHHDPDGEFDDLVQVLPFGPALQAVMEPSLQAGAVGFVGVFDAPWESCEYYVPYDGVERPIPGVWVSRADGERLRALAGAPARITVESTRTDTVTHNVVGTLPGGSQEWVIVGSHHDGPWASAVEDASGVALVLAQARYWAGVAPEDRPHNMLFLVTSGHMCHGAGTRAFIEAHADLLDAVVLEMHLEHTARECRGEDGRLMPTDDPEVRWWFTSRNENLLDTVHHALRAEDLRRSLVIPPDIFAPQPTTDGGFFHLENVPLVNFLTAPMYLFDAADTPDKIHEASLEPVTRAAVRILASTAGTSARAMREGVAE